MSKSVTYGYGLTSGLGNGRHYTFTQSCDLIEVLSDGSNRAYVADKQTWTLQCSGFEPCSNLPTVGTVTTVACSAGGGTAIVTSVKRSADVGGIATYDVTFQGT